MAKMLIYIDSDLIESVNSQVVEKVKHEVEQIDVVLHGENANIIPADWHVVTINSIRDENYSGGMYVHASRNNSSLIKYENFGLMYTVLYVTADMDNPAYKSYGLMVAQNDKQAQTDSDFSNNIKQFETQMELFVDINDDNDMNRVLLTDPNTEMLKISVGDVTTNLLEASRKNSNAKKIMEHVVAKNFTLVDYNPKTFTNVFVKRTSLSRYLPQHVMGLKLENFEGVFYTVESKNKLDENSPERLIVIFSSMPGPSEYYSAKFEERAFVKHFPTMQKLLVPNTHVLRIMDSNLLYGSHYVDTQNFTNYESIIQKLISKIKNELSVGRENVVLYGTSKGGTGALIHSLMGNYKSVTVDPIIDAYEYNEDMNNIHFIKDNRIQSLVQKINGISSHEAEKKFLIRAPKVQFNYEVTKKIKNPSVRFYDQRNSNIEKHPRIGQNSVSEILMFLNMQLLGMNLVERNI